MEGLESVKAEFQLQDCYSLGCILVEMLGGEPVFDVSMELAAEVYEADEEDFVRVCLLINKKGDVVCPLCCSRLQLFAVVLSLCYHDRLN